MLTDEQAIKLHHRSALGQPLTAEEQAELEVWYAKQDALEEQSLNFSHREAELTVLRQKLAQSLNELVTETQKLQQSELENERLRQEIEELQQQVNEILVQKAA